jgi:hypothetical protein
MQSSNFIEYSTISQFTNKPTTCLKKKDYINNKGAHTRKWVDWKSYELYVKDTINNLRSIDFLKQDIKQMKATDNPKGTYYDHFDYMKFNTIKPFFRYEINFNDFTSLDEEIKDSYYQQTDGGRAYVDLCKKRKEALLKYKQTNTINYKTMMFLAMEHKLLLDAFINDNFTSLASITTKKLQSEEIKYSVCITETKFVICAIINRAINTKSFISAMKSLMCASVNEVNVTKGMTDQPVHQFIDYSAYRNNGELRCIFNGLGDITLPTIKSGNLVIMLLEMSRIEYNQCMFEMISYFKRLNDDALEEYIKEYDITYTTNLQKYCIGKAMLSIRHTILGIKTTKSIPGSPSSNDNTISNINNNSSDEDDNNNSGTSIPKWRQLIYNSKESDIKRAIETFNKVSATKDRLKVMLSDLTKILEMIDGVADPSLTISNNYEAFIKGEIGPDELEENNGKIIDSLNNVEKMIDVHLVK